MGRWGILNGVLGVIVVLLGFQIALTWRRTLPPVEIAARGTDPGVKDQDKPDGKTGGGRRGGKRGANEKVEQQPTVLVTTIVNKDSVRPEPPEAERGREGRRPRTSGRRRTSPSSASA